jgi:beta-N-acetylhexosaminidase
MYNIQYMKKTLSILSIIFLSILFLAFPQNKGDETLIVITESTPLTEPEFSEPVPIPKHTKSTEEILLESMTIEEKVGQLFIFGFDGQEINANNKQFIQDLKIGGVLLLSKNISNENQLKQLITEIQSTNNIPLFISIDQEGGPVARIRWNDTLTKSQTTTESVEEAYNIAKSRGEILKSYGINMNLAPVVEYITDSNSFMYKRVYRGSKEDVYLKSIASIKGYTDSNIIAVPKHYPGHSNESPDSHYDLPHVNINNDQWIEYTEPFSNVLKNTKVDALMIGHIKFPNIDSKASTVSYEILTNRLVRDLEYRGLIISDDMEMDALKDVGTYTEIAKEALLAGNDILIYSKYSTKNPAIQKDIYNYIVQEVRNGNMNIDSKVLKILKIKLEYGILVVEE